MSCHSYRSFIFYFRQPFMEAGTSFQTSSWKVECSEIQASTHRWRRVKSPGQIPSTCATTESPFIVYTTLEETKKLRLTCLETNALFCPVINNNAILMRLTCTQNTSATLLHLSEKQHGGGTGSVAVSQL